MNDMYLGGEASLFDPNVEKEGVQAILESLTEEEKAQMPDPAMPVRHLRADKVRQKLFCVVQVIKWSRVALCF